MTDAAAQPRNALTGVDTLFIERWSPRQFSPYHLADAQLARIIDAARWAPSCFNDQPWHFYTSSDTSFNEFLALLAEANQAWAQHASVLGFLIANKTFGHNGKANDYSAFDCGAAWMSMSLQARREGLYSHGMGGIKKAEVAQYLALDESQHSVVMGFAIGAIAADSPEAKMLSERKALDTIWTPK